VEIELFLLRFAASAYTLTKMSLEMKGLRDFLLAFLKRFLNNPHCQPGLRGLRR
jgi:hypothetical protein